MSSPCAPRANGKVIITRNGQAKTRGQRLLEHLRGRDTLGMTTEEIMAATRGEV